MNQLCSHPSVEPRPALGPYVPRLYAEAIFAHVVRNLQNLPGPLFLGIDGPSGTGKTFGVMETLRQARVSRITLSGADLESPQAGRPAALVRQAYLKAAAAVAAGKAAAVVLDDLDAALGRWDEATTYTVNHQLTVAELMHLADSPTRVDGRTVRRVPVIVTGNHLARLYAPLRRPGRMQIHTWNPSRKEKIEVVLRIFHGVNAAAVLDLVNEFIDRPVAFFADLRRRAEEKEVRKAVGGLDAADAVRRAVKGQFHARQSGAIDPSGLIALGRRLVAEQTVKNHLEDER